MTGSPSEPRLLFVDDEPNVTAGIQRTFFDEFEIDTAESGEEALQLMTSEGPYTVLISDMRMPKMDGATLLARARTLEPNTVRMLLTGQADIDSAISAVNQGNIFRFLCKPCPEETLREALHDAIRQYNLIHAEKELLEDTLMGVVQVLADVLGLAAPAAFSRSSQLKACVLHMADELGLEDRWQLEIAAMLAYLGYVALPPDVMNKLSEGRELDEDETKLLAEHPEVSYNLLRRIPRLEGVADLVRSTGSRSRLHACPPRLKRDARLLSLAVDLDRRIEGGRGFAEALALLEDSGLYDAAALKAVSTFSGSVVGPEWVTKKLSIADLAPGMTLKEDVLSPSGSILIPKGREVNAAMIERLKNFAKRKAVVEPVSISIQRTG